MGNRDEQQLIDGLMLGRREAFEQLAARYERPLMNFIAGYVGDLATAEDLYQETFVRVIRSISEYHPRAGLASWIFAISRNLALDHLRRRKRRREVPLSPSREGQELNVIYMDPRRDRVEPSPDQGSEAAERFDTVYGALRRLAPKKREVIVLRFFSNQSYEEMEQLLGTPAGTLKFRVHEALRELSSILRGDFGEEVHDVQGSA